MVRRTLKASTASKGLIPFTTADHAIIAIFYLFQELYNILTKFIIFIFNFVSPVDKKNWSPGYK